MNKAKVFETLEKRPKEFSTGKLLKKELERVKSGEGVAYTLDEIDAILENTIQKYENRKPYL
ncbi:MAG: hypothetical protein KBF73_04975 [Flavobacteriales bacterium]|nr:hypothetical protein [Flavobacteriales bacterium]